MSDIQSEKLEYFEREIMNRVQAESEAIRAETQRMKDEALEQEKARLYDELYNDIQAQVAQIRKDTAGEIAHETQQMKHAPAAGAVSLGAACRGARRAGLVLQKRRVQGVFAGAGPLARA